MIYFKICALKERVIDTMHSRFGSIPLLHIKYSDVLTKLNEKLPYDFDTLRTKAMSALKILLEKYFSELDSSVVAGIDHAKEILKLQIKNNTVIFHILIVYNNSDNTLSIYLRKDESHTIETLIRTALKSLL